MNKFSDLKPGEKTILIIRRHWWYFVKPITYSLLLLLAAIGVFIFFGFNLPTSLLLLGIILVVSGMFLYYWFLWKNDLYILTDQRIIDINRNNIFYKNVTEFSLDKIQDVSYQIRGAIPMMVGFGVVVMETAGELQNITIELAPRPEQIQRQISQAFHSYRQMVGLIKNNKVSSDEPLTTHGEHL